MKRSTISPAPNEMKEPYATSKYQPLLAKYEKSRVAWRSQLFLVQVAL